jgi:Xaa-Pro aminopeptidase
VTIVLRDGAYEFNAALDAVKDVGATSDLKTPEYAEFDAAEYSRRSNRLRALMNAEGMDAVLATQEENVRYFSGYLTMLWISKFRPLVAVIPQDGPAALVISGQEVGNANLTSWIEDIAPFPPQEPPVAFIVRELEARGLVKGRIGIELGFGQRTGMSYHQLHELSELLPHAEIVDATPLMQSVRMLKSPEEISRLRRAAEISASGVETAWRSLQQGQTESEILQAIAAAVFAEGAEMGTKPSFFAVIAGDRWQLSNAVASDYAIRTGDSVVVDGGASYRGYACDFIRHASLGEPTAEHRRWYDAAVAATEAAIEAIRPGIEAREVYEAGIDVLAQAGFAEHNRMNIIGHGIGADVHELPWVGDETVFTSDTILQEGMVLCIEPGISPPSELALRSQFIVEDEVEVTARGTNVLTSQLSNEIWVA